MDISKEYIEMCQKAQEIQDNKPTDFIIDNHNYLVIGENSGKNNEIDGFYERGEYAWLPKQDQLQNMIKTDSYLLKDKTRGIRLAEYCEGWCLSNEYMEQFETMEQLWLATVMEENYNKRWNFETKEWEKI